MAGLYPESTSDESDNDPKTAQRQKNCLFSWCFMKAAPQPKTTLLMITLYLYTTHGSYDYLYVEEARTNKTQIII